MGGFLGLAFGLLIVLGLTGAGVTLLRDSIAQGDSIVLPLLLLAIPLLVAGWIVAAVLRFLIRPLRGHANLSGVIALATAAVLGAGIYLVNSDIPLQRPDAAVTAAVAPACAGQPVAAAGVIATGAAVRNHIVVLDTAGAEFDWTGKPAVDWRPPTVDDVELVACVQADEKIVVVEVCEYNGPSTTRYSATRTIRVVAARTGVELAGFSITSQPESCPPVKSEDMPEITASVDWWQAEDHLESLVLTGAFVDPDPRETASPWESDEPGWTSEPAWTPEPTAEIREVSLAAALDEGLVAVKAIGDSLQSLDIEITSKADEDLSLRVPAGTYFVPKRAATQTMVVISTTWFDLPAGEVVDELLDVACAQMHDDQPGEAGKADTFTVRETAAGGDLAKLLKSDAFAEADFRVQQFAIWTITNNPTKAGYVHLGTFGVGSGPSAAELREIKSMFKAAGIPTGKYRALP